MPNSPTSWGPPPVAVLVCGTVLGVAALAAVVVLTLAGQDSEVVFRLINLGLSALGLLFGVGGMLYAGTAAKASRAAEEQLTNGALVRAIGEAEEARTRSGPPGQRQRGRGPRL